MPPRRNPLKLNPLQLKTLTLLQAMAEDPGISTRDPETGTVSIGRLPAAHGHHFHIGPWIVMASDATGLDNLGVMMALNRKGLIAMSPIAGLTLTRDGQDYDTGLRESILHAADHGPE